MDDMNPTFEITFSSELKKLCLSENLADFHFKVGEAKIPAHKVVLSCGSRYFNKLFTTSNSSEIKFPWSKCILKNLLKFIYSKELSFTADEASDMLEVAMEYQISPLIETMSDYYDFGGQVKPMSTPDEPVSKKNAHINMITLDPMQEINHIKVQFKPLEKPLNLDTGYFYYVQTSQDKVNWKIIIDYRNYACGSIQDLYFEKHKVKFINLTSVGPKAEIEKIKVDLQNKFPQLKGDMVFPTYNVAIHDFGATSNSNELLDGKKMDYDYERDFGKSLVVRLSQPYIINSMRLLLSSKRKKPHKYFIEYSLDNKVWNRIVDHSNKLSLKWQNFSFEATPMLFIRMKKGNEEPGDPPFHVNHFECPSQDLQNIEKL